MRKKALTDIRKIITIGNARGISLPEDWLRKEKLKVGDRVLLKVEKV